MMTYISKRYQKVIKYVLKERGYFINNIINGQKIRSRNILSCSITPNHTETWFLISLIKFLEKDIKFFQSKNPKVTICQLLVYDIPAMDNSPREIEIHYSLCF